tara:strand:- start:59 stop:601 length:543 start_codon:yes stop_codon:yes gene_type:complete
VKLNSFLKSIPLISTLLLIIFISINNQNSSTKLRLLIWNTPTLSLGSYLAISTGAGFILSYILTTNIATKIKIKSVKPRQYNTDFLKDDTNEYNFTNIKNNEEKTLIERNISDPSPTMDAKFRVISNTEINNRNYIDSNSQYETSYDYDESNIDQKNNNENTNQKKNFSSDWNDDSFTSW